MKALRIGLAVLVVVVLPSWVVAQEETERPHEKEMAEGMHGDMAMPKPAPEMEKYSWIVGRWSVDETHEPGPFGSGGEGEGTLEVALGPGGFSHAYTYNSHGPMGHFSGHGLMAWDPEAKVYRSAWTDNMTPGMSTSECREEGNDLVCIGEGTMEGKKVSMRTRAMNPRPEGWTEVFEISAEGGPYQKVMTLEYEKAK